MKRAKTILASRAKPHNKWPLRKATPRASIIIIDELSFDRPGVAAWRYEYLYRRSAEVKP